MIDLQMMSNLVMLKNITLKLNQKLRPFKYPLISLDNTGSQQSLLKTID